MRSRKSSSLMAGLLRRLRAAQTLSDKTGMPADESLDVINQGIQHGGRNADPEGRRRFLKQLGIGAAALGAAGSAAASSPASAASQNGKDPGRVAIIGGGLAGLRCAHRLQQYRIASTIYEGNARLGGRVNTNRSIFPGLNIERGGEMISTEHTHVRKLARKLGLDIEDVNGNAVPGGHELYWVNGQYYTEQQLNEEWREVYRIFKDTEQHAPWVPTYYNHNALHRDLDHVDVNTWLDQVGIGANSNMGQIFQADVVVEYGIRPEQMTALNLVYLLAWNPINSALPLAGTDERFHIVGGNDLLASRMVEELPQDAIETGRKLAAISGRIDGPYTLSFEDGSVRTCDHLVLALPFTLLREVDIDPVLYESFRPEKRLAIERMSYGSNGKLALHFDTRPWIQPQMINGEQFTGSGLSYVGQPGLFETWDSTAVNGRTDGVLTGFFGADYGHQIGGDRPFAAPAQEDINHFLSVVENYYPGVNAAFNGTAMLSKWSVNPWSKGSYSTPALGDFTEWWGAQPLQEGNIHFCGEHTELEVFGYMEAAISTGERVAKEIHHA